jgi:osmotically-inducible protein OsmY
MFLVLAAAIEISAGGTQAQTNQESPNPTDIRSSDEIIQSKLEEALRLDGRINWQVLEVKVAQGNVGLFGEVRSPEERGLAGHIASTIPGVRAIRNQIIVNPALPPQSGHGHIEEQTRKQVLEGPGPLEDRQILP